MLVHYFTAPWCGPCKVFGPALTAFAEQHGIEIVRHNVDEESDAVKEYGIQSVPTTIWLDDHNKLIAFRAGAISAQQMEEYLQR